MPIEITNKEIKAVLSAIRDMKDESIILELLYVVYSSAYNKGYIAGGVDNQSRDRNTRYGQDMGQ